MIRFLRATALHFTQGLSVEFLYRIALLESLLGAALHFLGIALFWLAAGRSMSGGAGYTPALIVAYFVITGVHNVFQESRITFNLSIAIRMGKLSSSLLRPYPYLASVLAQAAAHAVVRTVLLAPILALMVQVTPGLDEFVASLTLRLAGIYGAALAMSLVIGWLTRIALGLLAFDMTQTWGPELVFLSIYTAASGTGYPPDLLPEAWFEWVSWTPVYYMVGFPALALLGRLSPEAVASGFSRGLIVTIATGILVSFMWWRGTKRFEAVGI